MCAVLSRFLSSSISSSSSSLFFVDFLFLVHLSIDPTSIANLTCLDFFLSFVCLCVLFSLSLLTICFPVILLL
ncbi:hypothetical protein DFH27DRAFT_572466 [Peziza echinospora]|nr:hypothetical protein DFH27DRAFT_572466 [Peziza echinospora]